MSLLLAATMAVTVLPIGEIDLASPTIYVSGDARSAIVQGTTTKLACIPLPERSRKFRTACLTSGEWQEAVARTRAAALRGSRSPEELNGLPQQPGPIPNSPYKWSYGSR